MNLVEGSFQFLLCRCPRLNTYCNHWYHWQPLSGPRSFASPGVGKAISVTSCRVCTVSWSRAFGLRHQELVSSMGSVSSAHSSPSWLLGRWALPSLIPGIFSLAPLLARYMAFRIPHISELQKKKKKSTVFSCRFIYVRVWMCFNYVYLTL